MCDPTEPFTTCMRLCDDDGMVTGEYLDRVNRLRAWTGPQGEHKPVDEPFTCTGHAHLAGEHIKCTSGAHDAAMVGVGPLGGIVHVGAIPTPMAGVFAWTWQEGQPVPPLILQPATAGAQGNVVITSIGPTQVY